MTIPIMVYQQFISNINMKRCMKSEGICERLKAAPIENKVTTKLFKTAQDVKWRL